MAKKKKIDKSKLVARIMCIFLAALMGLGGIASVIYYITM